VSNPWVVTVLTVLIIAASAFFVAVAFALLAARRHRLEDAAASSRSARAALRSSGELTVLLAGSQLGITVCALALGAITKPAVDYPLTPVFLGWGLPEWVAEVSGFVLALLLVTFLHLLVGEMAPKSWAIAHPERSATMLALPMRGFMFLTRPLLIALNQAANWCLRRVGVQPVDELNTGQNPDDLRHLVEHSANVGALEAGYSRQISGALEPESLTVRELTRGDMTTAAVGSAATVADFRATSLRSGHQRVLVMEGATAWGWCTSETRSTCRWAPRAPTSRGNRSPWTWTPGSTWPWGRCGRPATTSRSSPTPTGVRSAWSPWPTCCGGCSRRSRACPETGPASGTKPWIRGCALGKAHLIFNDDDDERCRSPASHGPSR